MISRVFNFSSFIHILWIVLKYIEDHCHYLWFLSHLLTFYIISWQSSDFLACWTSTHLFTCYNLHFYQVAVECKTLGLDYKIQGFTVVWHDCVDMHVSFIWVATSIPWIVISDPSHYWMASTIPWFWYHPLYQMVTPIPRSMDMIILWMDASILWFMYHLTEFSVIYMHLCLLAGFPKTNSGSLQWFIKNFTPHSNLTFML